MPKNKIILEDNLGNEVLPVTDSDSVFMMDYSTRLTDKIRSIDLDVDNIASKIESHIVNHPSGGNVDLTPYQQKTDDTLTTTNKTVVGAINEVYGLIYPTIPNMQYLYKDGVENTQLIGGWNTLIETNTGTAPTIEKRASNIYATLASGTKGLAKIINQNAINLSSYTKLIVEFYLYNTPTADDVTVVEIRTTYNWTSGGDRAKATVSNKNNQLCKLEIDVTNINELCYIEIAIIRNLITTVNQFRSAEVRKIWVE